MTVTGEFRRVVRLAVCVGSVKCSTLV